MPRKKKVIEPGPKLKQRFTLPFLPPTTNQIISLAGSRSDDRRFSKYNLAKKEWDEIIAATVAIEDLIPYDVPVWVHLDFYVNAKKDYDNIEGCQKFILDGMKQTLIREDSQRWLNPVTRSFHPKKKEEEVVVVVTISNYPMFELVPID